MEYYQPSYKNLYIKNKDKNKNNNEKQNKMIGDDVNSGINRRNERACVVYRDIKKKKN